jgi:hypothetical protein
MKRKSVPILLAALLMLLMNSGQAQPNDVEVQKFPNVIAVKVRVQSPHVYDFDVTISSRYDSPARYADGFRVMSVKGVFYGERILLHDHASEQPFTRDLYNVKIPQGVETVLVQARDKIYGYGGKSVRVNLPIR